MRVLLDRIPDSTEVVVDGWRAAALPGRVYPALVGATGRVTASLFTGLTGDEWLVLDAFEDKVYDLCRLDTSDGQHGWAYVCPDDAAVLPHDWDAAAFERRDLAAYVERCGQWRQRYDATRHG